MTRNNHNEPWLARVVRYSSLLLVAALFAAPQAHALDTGDIVIVGLKGDVHVTMKGVERAVKAGSVLELPATVQTGRDGAIDLRQGETAVSVGPDTLLEFPALTRAGGPIDRIVQPRGNAFYSIGKRGPRKLRVETPYLVGVVKGTQFNVAAEDTKTSISLFEGLLEIRASDDSSVVDIKAGEIATRSLIDTSIGVLQMEPGKVVAPPRAPQSSRSDGAKPPVAAASSGNAPGTPASPAQITNHRIERSDSALTPAVNISTAAEVRADVEVAPAPVTETGGGSDVDVGGSVGTNATLNAGVDAGAVAVDVAAAASTSVGEGVVDTVSTTNGGPGAGSVPVGGGAPVVDVPVAIEPTVSVGADLGNSAGSVDTGNAGTVDAGNPNAAHVEVHAGANGGPLSTGVGADNVVDLGGDHGPANVDLGANADLHAGSKDLDVGVALDLDDEDDQGEDGNGKGKGHGHGHDGNPGKGNAADGVVDTVDDTVKGLLRKPGKK